MGGGDGVLLLARSCAEPLWPGEVGTIPHRVIDEELEPRMGLRSSRRVAGLYYVAEL